VPGGVAKTFIQTKEPELKGVFDEWLARIVCYAFSVSHQAFVNQNNRSTGETQKEMAEEEGLWPILKWAKRLIDGVLNEDFGETELEFAWGEDAQIDAAKQAQVLTSYVDAGILTRNEARAKLGEAPVALAAADTLTVTTGSGPVVLGAGDRAQQLDKAYDPEQPRDWHGRFATTEGRGAKQKSSDRDWLALAGPDTKTDGDTPAPKPNGIQIATGPGRLHSGENGPAARSAEDWINRLQDWIMGRAGEKGDESSAPATPEAPAAAAGTQTPGSGTPDDDEDKNKTPLKRGTFKGSTDGLTASEKEFVERQLDADRDVEVIPRTEGQKTADFLIDGVRTELKTVSGVADRSSDGLSKAVSNRIMNARSQSDVIAIDALKQEGMTREIAERAIKRARFADHADRISRISIETPDGTVVWSRK